MNNLNATVGTFILIHIVGLKSLCAQDLSTQIETYSLKVSQAIELRALTHIRFQEFQDEAKIDGFDIRRARLDFRGEVSPKIGYRLQLELAGGPKILDATIVCKPYEYLNVNIGQSKTPYCYDNLYSPWTLLSISRTQIDNALSGREDDLYGNQNGRDIGLSLSGKFSTGPEDNKRPVVEYTLGVYNGAGINVADNNKEKDFGAALRVSPVKNLWLSGRFYSGHGITIADPGITTDRLRYGADLSYHYDDFILEAEYLAGIDESESLAQLKRHGFYVTLGYTPIDEKLQVLVRLDNYDPNSELVKNSINKYILVASWFFNKTSSIKLEYAVVHEEGKENMPNNILALQFQAAL